MAEYPDAGPAGPPIGGIAPPLQCNRLLSGTFEAPDYCGKPGTWHIIWTADAENGIACDEHADEARRLWVYFGMHRYDPVCSMPGAVYIAEEDRCEVDEGTLGLVDEAALALTHSGGSKSRMMQSVFPKKVGVDTVELASLDDADNGGPSDG